MSDRNLLDKLRANFLQLRRNAEFPPDLSIVIPVNAQGDLRKVLGVLQDLASYSGQHTLELILVVNNYEPGCPPPEAEAYGAAGMKVVSIPNVRRPGESPSLSARVRGTRAASAAATVSFDADCRIPNATALLDWYVEQFRSGARAAYTHVSYYELADRWSVRARILIHHAARWLKRVPLRIPTIRGSNYGVESALVLQLYEQGRLADEMNVGPNVKATGGRIAYCGRRDLRVLTSGRMFGGGWLKLLRYLRYRLRYNFRVARARANAAQFTGREKDPVRRYVNNKPAI